MLHGESRTLACALCLGVVGQLRKALVAHGWFFWAMTFIVWLGSDLTFLEAFQSSAVFVTIALLLAHAVIHIDDVARPKKASERFNREFLDNLAAEEAIIERRRRANLTASRVKYLEEWRKAEREKGAQ